MKPTNETYKRDLNKRLIHIFVTNAQIHAHTHTCTHTYTHTHVLSLAHAHIHKKSRTHTHTYFLSHTHTFGRNLKRPSKETYKRDLQKRLETIQTYLLHARVHTHTNTQTHTPLEETSLEE